MFLRESECLSTVQQSLGLMIEEDVIEYVKIFANQSDTEFLSMWFHTILLRIENIVNAKSFDDLSAWEQRVVRVASGSDNPFETVANNAFESKT